MTCPLKFILIVLFFYFRPLYSYEELRLTNPYQSFDHRTIIMLIIVGGILASVIMLTCVVFCLYFKVSRALRAAMEADDVAENCHNLAKITESKCLHNKFARAKTTTTESCRALQCCDECGIYADFDPLPPCYCDINEGL